MLKIIHEDDEMLVVNKPAGLVCHPTKTDESSSLIGRVRLHLAGMKADERPHLINRLDRETSGVVVVARTEIAARALRRLWETREARKTYVAIVHGHLDRDSGIIDAPLGKDDRSRVAIKDCVRADGLPSQTGFRLERSLSGPFSVVRAFPLTGRKHQIRIHLAHIGHPIVGDKIYGGDEDLYLALVEGRLSATQQSRLLLPYHALHAESVEFQWRGRTVTFRCEPERWFLDFTEQHETR